MGMDRKIEKKKWPPMRIAKFGGIGVFGIIILFWLLNAGGSSLNVEPDRITVSTVKKGPFQEFIPILGNVLPRKTIFLTAVEGGTVEKIFLEAGSKANKGDKILKLSNTNLMMTILNNEAQINRASNELRSTRLAVERNRLDLERQRAEVDYFLKRIKRRFEQQKILFKEKFISEIEFDELKDEYEYQVKKRQITIETQEKDIVFRQEQVKQLEASVEQMEESLSLVKEQLENLTIKAPISGHLTSLTAEIGESKNRGEQLGQIDQTDGFKVRAQIDEHYINRIEVGKVGEFDIADTSYKLKIEKVFPEVREGRFEVDLQFLDDEPDGIKRGQTLHIRLQLSEMSEALLLARGGFYQTTGGNWAYVVNESGEFAVKRFIRLGRQNPQFFEVLEGLKPGDRVVTSSYDNYGDMERLVFNEKITP